MSLVPHLRPGMVVVDVGANVGSLTSQFRQAGAEVWAVEPDPRCWGELGQYLDHGHLLGVALGDHDGSVTLYRSACSAHNSIALDNVLEPGIATALQVPMMTLDAMQAAHMIPDRIHAIKVDTQGAETTIARGAARLMATQQPLWFIEVWPEGLRGAGSSLDELCAIYEAAGYVPDDESWDGLKGRVATMTGHQSHDVLLRPA